MIIRYVYARPDCPYDCHIGYLQTTVDRYSECKKWLRRKVKLIDPGFEVQFKVFFEENDSDEI